MPFVEEMILIIGILFILVSSLLWFAPLASIKYVASVTEKEVHQKFRTKLSYGSLFVGMLFIGFSIFF
ncbi:hypothetical protein [Priestia endophytica]|jgi:hypothetical protein|uniref:Uncharacterized protein n=2 Tax=Priestia endophytica TaxID=135735 RepID=A0AAX1Q2B2_9BACI|nr:hypothetical protein [Priestia endophytica]KAB2490292.1 hypothetical protein F8155_20980 [Priestia endophytica]KYG30838.1 hypothetical protein AZF06_23490 [Priestia endophytica]MBG9811423.1 hypothetical protein [Priestia endophytica]RAS71809.1 hypothetical protein A3864_22250 [Priestia endophytica]RAS84694.1 hypothetical protein A4R27_04970 [Priestia endophytica]